MRLLLTSLESTSPCDSLHLALEEDQRCAAIISAANSTGVYIVTHPRSGVERKRLDGQASKLSLSPSWVLVKVRGPCHRATDQRQTQVIAREKILFVLNDQDLERMAPPVINCVFLSFLVVDQSTIYVRLFVNDGSDRERERV